MQIFQGNPELVLEFGCQISLDHHWQNTCINLIKLALPNKKICILPDANFDNISDPAAEI